MAVRRGSRVSGSSSGKGCLGCARACLLASSILFLIIGDVIVGAGIYFSLYDQQQAVQQLSQALPVEFLALRAGLIVVGAAIVLVSFCGCVGVVLNSRCALLLYLIVASLLAVACSAAAIAAVSVPALAAGVQSGVSRGLQRLYGNASLATLAVDSVQTRFECCGWPSMATADGSGSGCDWFASTAWHSNLPCPPSCCPPPRPPTGSGSCVRDSAHKQSCSSVLKDYLIAIPLALASAVILAFFHLICAFVLVLRRSRQQITAV